MSDYKELVAELKKEWNDCDSLISEKIAINLGMLPEKRYVILAENCCHEMAGIMQTIDCAIDAIEQIVKERDSAIADLEAISECTLCKHYEKSSCCEDCNYDYNKWEWRGINHE